MGLVLSRTCTTLILIHVFSLFVWRCCWLWQGYVTAGPAGALAALTSKRCSRPSSWNRPPATNEISQSANGRMNSESCLVLSIVKRESQLLPKTPYLPLAPRPFSPPRPSSLIVDVSRADFFFRQNQPTSRIQFEFIFNVVVALTSLAFVRCDCNWLPCASNWHLQKRNKKNKSEVVATDRGCPSESPQHPPPPHNTTKKLQQ
jgi:hypothetical protein